MSAPFASFLQAGFDPAFLPWNSKDLLDVTGHVPERNMAQHYAAVKATGICTVRDGLPWRHHPAPRLAIAEAADVEVIWDLSHFDVPPEPVAHALRVSRAADLLRTLFVCPMNEPTICSAFNAGFSRMELTSIGLEMLSVLKSELRDVFCVTTDPIVGAGEAEYEATDIMVASGLVDVVGVNYYPHTAMAPLREVLVNTWRRYGLPVSLTETSWHIGHPDHASRFFGYDKAAWLSHVLCEFRRAQIEGANIVGCCYYPATPMPSWDEDDVVWDAGLFQPGGLSLDPGLAAIFREVAA